ncbi:MAG: DNA translocase FtsK 4TM domain-containing protein [Clostridiaceae bacterium]
MKGKKTQKKKYKLKRKKNSSYSQEIQGILMLALGILTMLSFYVKDSIGMFGTFIRDASLGMLGVPAFLIPPVIILYSAILIFAHDRLNMKNKSLYIFFLFLLVSALMQTGHYRPEDYNGLTPIRALEQFYRDGTALSGGGVLGGLISLPILVTFRVLGTIIILTALSLVDIILLTNSSISGFIKNMRSLFIKSEGSKKSGNKRKSEQVSDDEDDLQSVVVGDGDDLSLRFDKRPKVIDFKIEKESKELKNKSDRKKAQELAEQSYLSEDALKEEPLELVISDLKRKKTGPKEYVDKPAAEVEPGLKEIVIKEAVKANEQVKYTYPPIDLLQEDAEMGGNTKNYRNQVLEGAKKLEETLNSFGVSAKVINVTRGPTVTRYELQPSAGVKVSRIVNLADDIALNLAAPAIRLEAPIPGKAAIGIEVPNKEVNMVRIRDVIESPEFEQHPSKLAFAVGKDVSGETIIVDIAKMPHLLIAGATGSGKSVCINSLIVSILYKAAPDEVKLLMIDPKVVELGIYNGIPHLLIPVVTEPKKAAGALNWAVQEMVNRYKMFADKAVRDIKGYNELMKKTGEQPALPQIVIIIDELADLMMVAPNDVEDAICRLAQMARAAGMHLVIATQRPSVDVITGVIKANIPSRISFAVSSQIDSRTILDMGGAEKLLGRGDMLIHPVGKPKPVRAQGANITDAEVEKVVEYVKAQGNASYDDNIIEEISNEDNPVENDSGDNDELLPKAIELVVDAGQASVSLIQRKFKVGYARAARIVDQMEARGIVGGFEGSKPRQILISRQQWQEMQMSGKE